MSWIAAIAWGHWMLFYFFEDNEALRDLELRYALIIFAAYVIVFAEAIAWYFF